LLKFMHFGELLRDCVDDVVCGSEDVNESFERKTFLVRSRFGINGDDSDGGCGEGKSIFMDPSWVRMAFIFFYL
jgi:hypothetical protein